MPNIRAMEDEGGEMKRLALILALLFLFLSLGCLTPQVEKKIAPETSEADSTRVSQPTPRPLITKDPVEMVLEAEDMPPGFLAVNSSGGDTGESIFYSVGFEREGNIIGFLEENPSFQGILWISNFVLRYNSVQHSTSAFREFERQFSVGNGLRSKVRYDTIGDEGLLLEKVDGDTRELELLFRKENVVSGIVVYGVGKIDSKEVVEYGRIVEEKIGTAQLQVAPSSSTGSSPRVYGVIGEKAGMEGYLYLRVEGVQTMDSFKDPYGSAHAPEPGKRFVVVDVTLISGSDDLVRARPDHMELQDADGNYHGPSSTYADYPGFLDASNINPGETLRGFVVFEVPTAATPDLLVYDDGMAAIGIKLR